MQLRVGIGIITFNRKNLLAETVARVRGMTRHPHVDLVVADDGSTDGTLEMLREHNVPVVTGVNMGIAWNKNRALFLLAQMLNCDIAILLEDDTHPAREGWETEWMEGARRWGHVNYAGPWMKHQFISGAGTAADPVLSGVVTAQCSSYTREALMFGGYFDPRFRGYGHEHVEHSRRLIRVGYGGTDDVVDGREKVVFKLIDGNVAAQDAPSYGNPAEIQRNLAIATQAMGERSYRAAWANETEMRQFRAEQESAIQARPDGFALHGGFTLPLHAAPPRTRSFAERLRGFFRWG